MARLLTKEDLRTLTPMFGFIAFLHVLGFGIAWPFTLSGTLGLGAAAVAAYLLGVRHGFDTDHIAAIDNITRKLVNDGRRSKSVGLFFSLGHSTVVFLMALAVALGVRSAIALIESEDVRDMLGLLGTLVSGGFLVFIGVVNLAILLDLVRAARSMGRYDEKELEDLLIRRGLYSRMLYPLMRGVTREWHAYPVGLLFGLGFDTATQIALLILTASAAALELPWHALLALPILFASGMTLVDTTNGLLMYTAYSWAFIRAARRLYYNITATGTSVAVALLIGSIELLQITLEKLGLCEGPWGSVCSVEISDLGFYIVALFAIMWIAAILIWRLGRLEERWNRYIS